MEIECLQHHTTLFIPRTSHLTSTSQTKKHCRSKSFHSFGSGEGLDDHDIPKRQRFNSKRQRSNSWSSSLATTTTPPRSSSSSSSNTSNKTHRRSKSFDYLHSFISSGEGLDDNDIPKRQRSNSLATTTPPRSSSSSSTNTANKTKRDQKLADFLTSFASSQQISALDTNSNQKQQQQMAIKMMKSSDSNPSNSEGLSSASSNTFSILDGNGLMSFMSLSGRTMSSLSTKSAPRRKKTSTNTGSGSSDDGGGGSDHACLITDKMTVDEEDFAKEIGPDEHFFGLGAPDPVCGLLDGEIEFDDSD